MAGWDYGLERPLPRTGLAGRRRVLRAAGKTMTSHYGQRRRYRHANYHLQEWRRRRRAAMQRNLLVAFLVAIMLPLVTVPAFAAQTVGNLPAVTGLSTTSLPQDMLIYDRHGNLLADIGDQGD